ncbi:VWA domain-containing protein [Roseovarius sp. ZX-A-9]|uniref:VWA domain-containing protein n=1 Tax=Roseovarius sp. ZX-A-9 TaxID=3014783 RepID=UPI00232E0D48|nr:VWA domain-containing protein [Roseovarius sp. ZX-A-9]
MKLIASKVVSTAISGAALCAATALAAEDVVIVYDASGSMWGQIDGASKIEIARDVMADLVNGWDTGPDLGLIAYGHRRQGDCSDIETLIAPGPLDRASFISTVNAIRPVGKTPLTGAVRQAAELLSYRDNPATVVLISDGVETCNADPCALSAELERQGVNFTAHVVGFDLEDEAHAGLSCIAKNTGGVFVPAGNADELHAALDHVQAAMDVPAHVLEPKPEPELPKAHITGPARVTTGAAFEVSWSEPIDGRDMVTILPMGAAEGARGDYHRIGDKTEGRFKAPAEPGLYELRYILDVGSKTLATAPVEVIAAEVSVTGPARVTTGAAFDVSWSEPIDGRDMVTILPMGAAEGTRGDYQRVGNKTEGTLRAPAEPGLYELRYILDVGSKTLATATVEVIAAEIGIAGPGTVRAESDVDVSWTATINGRDMITILPMGANEGTRGNYIRIGDRSEARLEAPAAPGIYEIRYILDVGSKTLASTPLEVVAADAPLDEGARLTVPATAAPGKTITVTWAGGSDSNDQRISLAEKDQADFGWITVFAIGEEKFMDIMMPDDPGLYEIRFLDVSNRVILGRAVVEVK